nr:MAG TPA: HEAT repeat associated with sister chromatid cohesion [Caudoviricetes sp.]
MRPQSELLTLSQMQKCTCDFLHSAVSVREAV